jgi:hypothetical protein
MILSYDVTGFNFLFATIYYLWTDLYGNFQSLLCVGEVQANVQLAANVNHG